MRALIEFYRGPAGTRVLVAMPDIVTELFASLLPGMPAVIIEYAGRGFSGLRARAAI